MLKTWIERLCNIALLGFLMWIAGLVGYHLRTSRPLSDNAEVIVANGTSSEDVALDADTCSATIWRCGEKSYSIIVCANDPDDYFSLQLDVVLVPESDPIENIPATRARLDQFPARLRHK